MNVTPKMIVLVLMILCLFFPDLTCLAHEKAVIGARIMTSGHSIDKKLSLIRITSILYVEDIESCLKFWVDALGFEKTVEIQAEGSLGFVILNSGATEVMLQTYSELEKDIPGIVSHLREAPSVLYIEVNDIAMIERRLKGFEVIVPKRKTFYGADEIYYRSPGGHIVGFAQQGS